MADSRTMDANLNVAEVDPNGSPRRFTKSLRSAALGKARRLVEVVSGRNPLWLRLWDLEFDSLIKDQQRRK